MKYDTSSSLEFLANNKSARQNRQINNSNHVVNFDSDEEKDDDIYDNSRKKSRIT